MLLLLVVLCQLPSLTMPSSAPKYEKVPVDEKPQDEPVASPPKSSVWSKKIYTFLVTMLLLSAVFFAMGRCSIKEKTQTVLEPVTESSEEATEWLAARATGDEYLLGVGKADITGPVVEINFMVSGLFSVAQVARHCKVATTPKTINRRLLASQTK